jgi:tetratricopeptide (TPR) repeat protein
VALPPEAPNLATIAFNVHPYLSSGERIVADQTWLKHTEQALLVGSGLGTVAAIAAQNVALASAPLTVMAAVGLLNRRQTERQLTEAQEKLARQQRQASHRLTSLSKQVTALPSPEALTNFQRSVLDRNNRTFLRMSEEIKSIRHHVDDRMQALHPPDLSQIHQDIAQLQDQYALTHTETQNLTSYVQRLATVPRIEGAEAKLSQVRTNLMQTRVTLEALRSETRNAIASLQDNMAQLERRAQEATQPIEAHDLRAEVAEMVKTVAHLVPQAEFSNLVNHVKDLTRQQADLERALTKIPVGSVNGMPSDAMAKAEHTLAELERLSQVVRRLQHQVSRQETAGHSREQVQQVVSQYLGQMKAQLAQLEGITQTLADRQRQLANQWATTSAEAGGDPAARQGLTQLAKRLHHTESAVKALKQRSLEAEPHTTPESPWILDFPIPLGSGAGSGVPTPHSASRQALEQALEQAQRRLLIVWPWASQITLDDDLLKRFTRLLDRGGQLELGWCHKGETQEGRLVWRISQRWNTDGGHLAALKAALNQLLPLREHYPDRFKFKIMGSAESYLVCDSGPGALPEATYAIVSLKALPTHAVSIPGVEAKLKTPNPQVVNALVQRFQDPAIAPQDKDAFFNRGTTRHDLRDQPGAISDYSRVLALQPDHAVALNNRGAARLEMNLADEAELDFAEAINHNPRLFAAYGNRGWLRLEQRRYPAAVQDFTRAIELKPNLPMAYVYRGSALQKLGDLKGAVRDYSDAIACGDPIALPYCYRSAAYESQGDAQRAIADLERASVHLEAQGDYQALSSVQRTLQRLQNRTLQAKH